MTDVFLRENFNTDTERIQWKETQEEGSHLQVTDRILKQILPQDFQKEPIMPIP